ncbi:MAG TPA: O-antigen ligase family protein [Thermoanaerobaculia bacterium]|nr:O-antigen ligase family protein [Thermoanaerobaculia bacterium]
MTVASSEWWVRDTTVALPSTAASGDKAEGATPFAALIVFTCILLLSPQTWFPALKPLRIAFLSAGLAAASLLWERRTHPKAVGFIREIAVCFTLLAWAFMTIPLSFWPGGSVARLTDVYIKSVIVFWLLANVITTEHRLFRLRTVLMFCSVPLAAMALKNYATGSFIRDSDVVTRIIAYDAAMSSNPNDLALMLNLLLPLSIACLLGARTAFVRSLVIGVIVINITAIIVTFSRAGFLGLATITALYFLRMIRRRGGDRMWAVAMCAVVILSLPLLPSTYVERIATVTSVEADPTGSSQARWRDTRAAAQFVGGHPIIGAGLGMDVLALNQVRGAKWVQVHNVYLQYAVDLGVPGVTLFVLLFCGVFKAVRVSRKRLAELPEHRDLFLVLEALETSLIVFAISGFFYPIAYDLFFYYIGGLALGARVVTHQVLSVTPART